MLKLTLAALVVFLAGTVALLAVPMPQPDGQCEDYEQPAAPQGVSDPEFIVIYTLKREKQFGPLMEFRILIRGKSEGEAVMKSTILIQKTFGITAIDVLEFREAQLKK